MAEIGCLSIQETALELVAIADPRQYGQMLLDMPIISTEALNRFAFERIIITSTDLAPQEAITILTQGSIPEPLIIAL